MIALIPDNWLNSASSTASVIGRLVTGYSAGALIETVGYVQFYLLTTLLALPGIALFWMLLRRGDVREAG